MKRFLMVLLVMALLLSLTACGPRLKTGTEEVWLEDAGVSVTIDYDEKTIHCGDDLYMYQVTSDYCQIRYPNGAAYWDYGFYHIPDDDYDPERYLPAEVLLPLLENERQVREKAANSSETVPAIFGCVLMLGMGLWAVIAPETLLFLRGGWMYKYAEPTDFALTMERIAGVAMIILAAVLFAMLIFG